MSREVEKRTRTWYELYGEEISEWIMRRVIGIVTGNPRVFQGNPDPYPPEPAPVARVGVLAGSGKGFSGFRGL